MIDVEKLQRLPCSVEGCAGLVNARGLCKYHHKKHLRLGLIKVVKSKALGPRFCSVEGCGGKHLARGWCDYHYCRWKRYRDPLGVRSRKHRLTRIDTITRTAECEICGRVNVGTYRRVRRDRGGKIETGWHCPGSHFKYRKIARDKCSRCGFVPEHTTQIDVDHIVSKHLADESGLVVKDGVAMDVNDPRIVWRLTVDESREVMRDGGPLFAALGIARNTLGPNTAPPKCRHCGDAGSGPCIHCQH